MYRKALSFDNCINKRNILEDELHKDLTDINLAVTQLEDLLLSAGKQSLKIRKLNKSTPSKHKKWFDKTCKVTKKEVRNLGTALCKDPNNSYLRGKLFALNKKYRKLVKSKKQEFKQDIINQLSNLSDKCPKAYWQLLDKLRSNNKNNIRTDVIEIEDWVDHFSRLYDVDNTLESSDFLNNFIHEDTVYFSELDGKIRRDEILRAIATLKNGKAIGNDGVLGEMIKPGKEILIHVDILVKLFNKILTSSIYTKQWKISYLTPIHKKGSIYETSNYRGICVNSVIAKLFSNVLNNRLMTFIKGRKLLNDVCPNWFY